MRWMALDGWRFINQAELLVQAHTEKSLGGAYRIGAMEHMSWRLQAISLRMERSSVVSGLSSAVSRNALV